MPLVAQKYGYSKAVNYSFIEALERTKKALQEQGFGVQAEINISSALREKLGIEVPSQIILVRAIHSWPIRLFSLSRK
jgi:uncharacterized protein (DUF302 family)